MERRILGRTGLEVTQLSYGAMELRGQRVWRGRPVTDEQAERILNAVLDAGINFIDTAYDYGLSEEYIGRFISHRRHEYYLATKCGCTVVNAGDHDENPHVWTRDNLLHNIDTSLRRMKTDYVDLWQLHNPSVREVERGDVVRVMEEVKAAGKVRWIGISSTLERVPKLVTTLRQNPILRSTGIGKLLKPGGISAFISWGVFDAFQMPYSALNRAHEMAITAAAQAGAGTIIRGGVLEAALIAAAQAKEGGQGDRWTRWNKANLDELLAPGESRNAFLLRFALTHPDLHTTIVGTLNPDHLAENLRAAAAGPLPADVYAEAKRRLAAIGEQPAASPALA